MGLFLVETDVPTAFQEKDLLTSKIEQLSNKAKKDNVALIEVQVGADFAHAFFVFETEEESGVREIVESEELTVTLIKAVRLIGGKVESQQAKDTNYLVEWNLPEGLTMEKYLQRKQEKSPLYEQVPDVDFIRTYVCEDMTKCLCFYQAPNEEVVRQARDVVDAPVDSLTKIASLSKDKV